MAAALEELGDYMTRKAREIESIEKLLRASAGFNHRQLALLSHAMRHPSAVYTVKSHQNSHGVVQQTARTDLYELADLGLLLRHKRGRTFYFHPAGGLKRKLKEI